MSEVMAGPCVTNKLLSAGIRTTRQRIALAELLFAEELHAFAEKANQRVSLATVYNTLKHFSEAGLVREVATPGQTSYFDTNVSDHHHYFVESESTLVDITDASVTIHGLPEAPLGKRVGRVDIIVHLVD
jgi:Fur family iron response transcriptional regulator